MVIVDNSANAHICSYEYMFTENIEPILCNVVATLGRKYLIPKGIGTVRWSCTGDEGKHTNKLNSVIYFPDSPVKILSATALDESMKDGEGTWKLTKTK